MDTVTECTWQIHALYGMAGFFVGFFVYHIRIGQELRKMGY